MPTVLNFATTHEATAVLPAALALRPGYAVEFFTRRVSTLLSHPVALNVDLTAMVNGSLYTGRDQHGLGLDYGLDGWRGCGSWVHKVLALPESGSLDSVRIGLRLLEEQRLERAVQITRVALTDRGAFVAWLWESGMAVPTSQTGRGHWAISARTVEDTLDAPCLALGSGFALVPDLALDRAIAGNARARIYHDRVRKTFRLVVPSIDQWRQDLVESFYELHREETFLFLYDSRIPARRVVFAREPLFPEVDADELRFNAEINLAEV
jgi:hypothetical protein